jgi:hypothetical protein
VLHASDKCSHTLVCCAFSIGLRLALEPDMIEDCQSKKDSLPSFVF